MSDKPIRYSDEELEEFRVLINEKIARAQKEYDELMSSTVDNSTLDDNASITNPTDAGVDAAMMADLKRQAERQQQFISKLKAALDRIDNKTYGICRVTGQLIPKDRLRAVPHATLSIEAKNK